MKSTIVPAEVTTVEDRVTGNLSVSQLALFAFPMFIGSILYWMLPPSMDFSPYKLVVIGIITATSFVLAIRIHGKIVLLWLMVISKYYWRPKLYLFNKQSAYAREDYPETKKQLVAAEKIIQKPTAKSLQRINVKESDYVHSALNNPAKSLHFTTNKKGGLNVRITEI